ncbi:phycobilisome rod-core linker polypeptide [Oscillatoriales cyanobacterium LEGE 11467]|uniref:Phycobilisome rod-core linker polypeptide n=1 Tax=Zarconia navalis LEGE 11467 TaxID=1828826 RepID=A0A928VZR6_9CYAN|nr:phycobilisome rod-core linker polypeptide [Zarconia navalis]MBE9040650.1 phycobilisome rod-core linker polypeptide [Zarconia navalis LEGE 11467]
MSLWAIDSDRVALRPNATEDDVQAVIRAVYRQVLGNPHLLESDRLISAESGLCNGDISVRQFVRAVAKSGAYRSRFFERSPQYRFIELNFKHLLGRAPQDQSEIARHVLIYNESGYDAEIDSYIDSAEYLENFGEDTVPFARSTQTQVGIKNVGFNRMFALMRGYATSDSSNKSALVADLAANAATKIVRPAGGSGAYSGTGKRFRIQAVKGQATSRRSNVCYTVSYNQLSQNIQSIHKTGGKILSISEIA